MEKIMLIASNNPGKIKEIQAILSPLRLKLVTTETLSTPIHVEETGHSFAENARLKAAAYYQKTGLISLADDSGLEVDALEGAPGIFSARYSPKINASDADRREHLLKNLRGKERPWKAHFHCAAVMALPGNKFIEVTGRCDGIIIPEERGNRGFGYDPIFYIPEYDATMAELPTEIKNTISHRARALKVLLPFIKNILNLPNDE